MYTTLGRAAMHHIFLSYCREDADFAQILEQKIAEAGFATWRDINLSAGDDWRVEIDDGIKRAVAVVVIMSPASRISQYVNYEWAFAIGSGVPVLPVVLKLSPGELHSRLSVIQYLDFSNYLNRPWERLVEALRDLAHAEREFTLQVPRNAPPVVRQAAGALDSMNTSERSAALSSLAQMNHPAAIELLADAVHHPIQEVRFGAAVQLAQNHRDSRGLPALMEALRNQKQEIKPTMISCIGEPAVPVLAEALGDKEFGHRHFIFTTLGYIGGAPSVQILIEYLRDSDPEARLDAASALSSTENSTALPALRAAIDDPDAKVREGIASALGTCGGVTAIPDLLKLLHDLSPGVRHKAAYAIRRVCETRPLPAGIEPLVPRLIDALLEALHDVYDQVQHSASAALQGLGDPRSIPGLLAALGQKSAPTNRISDVLKALGDAALPALHEAMRDSNERLRLRAMELVSEFDDEKGASRFVEAMGDQSPDVRLAAIRHIGYKQSRSPVALQAFIERLHDPEEDVSSAAINKLKYVGDELEQQVDADPSLLSRLVECLQVETLAPSVAELLERFDSPEARTALNTWRKQQVR